MLSVTNGAAWLIGILRAFAALRRSSVRTCRRDLLNPYTSACDHQSTSLPASLSCAHISAIAVVLCNLHATCLPNRVRALIVTDRNSVVFFSLAVPKTTTCDSFGHCYFHFRCKIHRCSAKHCLNCYCRCGCIPSMGPSSIQSFISLLTFSLLWVHRACSDGRRISDAG